MGRGKENIEPEELEEIAALNRERKNLEAQIVAARQLLAKYKVGMSESLVDSEDFPRADIDVYRIRLTRVDIIRAQNDCKKIMQQLDEMVSKYQQYHRENHPEQTTEVVERPPTLTVPPEQLAIVGDVSEGSPSFIAGMRKDDIIIEFGRVNASNFKSLQDISREVQESLDLYIKVIVQRDGRLKRFNLKPRAWSGAGHLGCFIFPLAPEN